MQCIVFALPHGDVFLLSLVCIFFVLIFLLSLVLSFVFRSDLYIDFCSVLYCNCLCIALWGGGGGQVISSTPDVGQMEQPLSPPRTYTLIYFSVLLSFDLIYHFKRDTCLTNHVEAEPQIVTSESFDIGADTNDCQS